LADLAVRLSFFFLGALAAKFRFWLFMHNKKGGRSRLFFEAGLA